MNVRFAWNNARFDAATLAARDSSGPISGDANFPLTNVQSPEPWRAYKSGSYTGDSVFIDVDFSSLSIVGSLTIVNHNLNISGTITIRAYSDSGRTNLIFEQTENSYVPLYGYGEQGYGEQGYGGAPLTEDLALFPGIARTIFFTRLRAQYFTIEINNSNDEFFIGRIFFSDYFEPSFNFARAWNYTLVDETRVDRSEGGQKHRDRRQQYHRINFNLNYLEKNEAFGEMIRILHNAGIREPMVISAFPEDVRLLPYTSFYGSFTQIPQTAGNSNLINRYSMNITFEEEI